MDSDTESSNPRPQDSGHSHTFSFKSRDVTTKPLTDAPPVDDDVSPREVVFSTRHPASGPGDADGVGTPLPKEEAHGTASPGPGTATQWLLATVSIVLLLLHFAGVFGAWFRDLPSGLLVDLHAGGYTRMLSAFIGGNLCAFAALYLGYKSLPANLGHTAMILIVAGIILGSLPQPDGMRASDLTATTQFPASGNTSGLWWAGRNLDRQLSRVMSTDAVGKEAPRVPVSYGDVTLGRVKGVLLQARAGFIYNWVKHTGGVCRTLSIVNFPHAGELADTSDRYILSHPYLLPLRPPGR